MLKWFKRRNRKNAEDHSMRISQRVDMNGKCLKQMFYIEGKEFYAHRIMNLSEMINLIPNSTKRVFHNQTCLDTVGRLGNIEIDLKIVFVFFNNRLHDINIKPATSFSNRDEFERTCNHILSEFNCTYGESNQGKIIDYNSKEKMFFVWQFRNSPAFIMFDIYTNTKDFRVMFDSEEQV